MGGAARVARTQSHGNSLASLLADKESGSEVSKSQSMKSIPESYGNYTSAPAASFQDREEDDLLQAKIEHLERERAELGRQLQSRDEQDRSRKLKIDKLESTVKAMETAKCEADGMVEQLKKEKEMWQEAQDHMLPDVPALASASSADSTSLASALAESLSKPPSYMSKEDPATMGLWGKMSAAAKELKRMEEEMNRLTKENKNMTTEMTANNEQLRLIQEKAKKDNKTMIVLKEAAEEADGFSKEVSDLRVENTKLSQSLEEALDEKIQLNQEILEVKRQLSDMGDKWTALEDELQTALVERDTAVEEAESLAARVGSEEPRNPDESFDINAFIEGGGDEGLVTLVEELQKKLSESEGKRKKLNAQLQELKGNVRVLVRQRPFLSGDGECRDTNTVCNKDETSVALQQPNKPTNTYHFDRVFNHGSQQEQVFGEVTDLIQSSLDGYRVCIFSYGQTGSGKTHTMSGDRVGKGRGIIPRGVEQVITSALGMKAQGWDMTVNISVVELYNEELKDLLTDKSGAGGAKASTGEKLKISNQQGRVAVAGLTGVDINCDTVQAGMTQLEQLLERSARNRTTVATAMNEVSSRSHMVFMLELTGRHSDGVTITRGGLRLVDLAGSERLDRTGTLNDAARLKETVNINKSLSCLGEVFMNLGNKSQHVPYRNSKLTMLLQDCLSGTGKSLMIVNISPTAASSHETLCSLRFADNVSQVELGKAQKQMYTNVAAIGAPANNSNSNSSSGSSSMEITGAAQPSAIRAPIKRVLGAARSTRQQQQKTVAVVVNTEVEGAVERVEPPSKRTRGAAFGAAFGSYSKSAGADKGMWK